MADSKQLFDDPEDLTMDDSEWDVESDASALITHARKRSATEALDFEKYMDNNEGFLVEDPNMSSYNYEDSMISDSFNKEADGDIDNNNHNNSGDNNNNNDDDDDDNNNNTNNNNNDDIKDSAAEEDATLGEYQKLKNELATIQSMTSAIEKITANFKVSQQGMIQFTETIIRTDQLLDTWIRLLSQAEYTKSLLQNEQWHGVSMDIANEQREEEGRQLALEQERIKAEQAAALAQAMAKQSATSKTDRGNGESSSLSTTRGRGRGRGRGVRGRGRGVSATSTSSTRATTAPSSTSTSKIPKTQTRLASTTQSRYQSSLRTRSVSRNSNNN